MQRRWIHATNVGCKSENKRPTAWNLPDLEKMSSKNVKPETRKAIKQPPTGWRKNKSLPQWLRNKYALKEKAMKVDFSKVKKLSPSTAKAIRMLHDEFPEELPTEKLSEFFKVSPVAIAKILKSRWTPTEKEYTRLEKRWQKNLSKQISEKLVETKFSEFIEETERKLKMDLPPFFKEELYQYYKEHGIDHVKNDFNELNEARIEREKVKDDKISHYVNVAINSNKKDDHE